MLQGVYKDTLPDVCRVTYPIIYYGILLGISRSTLADIFS